MTKWMDSENTEILEEELLDNLQAEYSLFYGGYIVTIDPEDLEDAISGTVSANFYALYQDLFKSIPTKMVFPMEQQGSACNAKFLYLDVVKNYIDFIHTVSTVGYPL